MQMSEVVEVTQVYGAGNANTKMAEGWKLLAVVPGKAHGVENTGVIFVLGKSAEKQKPKMPTAADLARANAGL